MGSRVLKVGVALVSAGLTGALLFAVYGARPRPKVVDFVPAEPRDPDALRAPDRTPGGSATSETASAGPGVLDAEDPRFPPSAFVRRPFRQQLFGGQANYMTVDPYVHYRYQSNLKIPRPWREHPEGRWFQRTNSLGLREDDELLPGAVDLRILIAGDSHTDGVCNNDEAFGNLLEARLRREHAGLGIESLNAGRGGYSFYHYLGTLERFLYLRPDVFVVAVYGGNDFGEVLDLFHEYNGTERPPGSELYSDLVERARVREDLAPALAQSFLSLKYFDVHPDQMEVALQAARDVTTEILVTCLRHSVHPIFVYIPSMADAEWDQHAELFGELAGILEISPAGLKSADRMADSYLAFLRDRRVDAIDLRPVFARAGAGNFWLQDEHMNLRAQELIAAELHPLVVAARPPGATRARRAPVSAGANPGDLLSPGSASTPVAEAATAESTQAMLELVSFEEPDAARLFVERPHTVFDPLAGYRYASDLELPSQELGLGERFSFVTNSQGLRNDEELAAADLRIVITGDEQVAGACPNPTTFAGLLEAALRRQRPGERIEALNAGVVGYSFFNYLGVLARSLELDPDVFVLTVSSGSDFLEGLRINCLLAGRKFWRSADGAREAFQAARQVSRPALEQGFESLHYFREHRPQGQRAYKVALDATLAVRDLCAEHGIELVVLHLPSAIDVEWKRHAAVFEQLGEKLGIEQRYMNTNLRLVAPYLQELQRIGVAVIDLEETLAGSEQPLYGADDFLITPAAHALIAERLLERLDELGLAGR